MFGRVSSWAGALICCCAFIFGPTTEVQAAGIFFSGNGVVSGGRAGAAVATGNSADAYIHNPANLSKLKGFGFRFDSILSFQTAIFTRAPEGKITFDSVSKDTSPAYIPALSFWYGIPNLGPGTLTLTLFAQAPHGRSGYRFPETAGECDPAKEGDAIVCRVMPEPGPNRATLIKTASTTIYFGLAAAYELRLGSEVKLRIGGTFRAQYINAVQRQAMIAAGLFYRPSSKKIGTGEVLLQINASGVGFTGDAGFSLDLPYGFSIGASVLLPVTAELSGTLDVQIKQALDSTVKIYGKNLGIETSFPLIFRSGIGWTGHALSVEVAFVGEFWSGASSQKMKPRGVEFSALGSRITIPEIEIKQNFHDSFSIRVGGEYNIKNWIWVRAGWWFETGALEEKFTSVGSIDYPNRMAFTAGLSARIPGGLMLSLSVMHILGRTVTVKDSPLRPTDLSPDGLKYPGGVPSTSNGVYQFGNTTLFLGIRGNWGPGSSARSSLAEAQ